MAALGALLLMAAAAQGPPPDAQARRVAHEMLEQLLAEDGAVYHFSHRDHDRVEIDSRPRASSRNGVCRFEKLSLKREPADQPGGGGISEIEATHFFLVLTGEGDRPLWDVGGEALVKSCAALGPSNRWFAAEDGWQAKAAVLALLALKEELLKPDPRPGVWSCAARLRCPDPKAIAKGIRPLAPNTVWGGELANMPCPKGKFCLSTSLDDPECGGWVTQLRMDRDELRFESAWVGLAAGGLHCGEHPGAEG